MIISSKQIMHIYLVIQLISWFAFALLFWLTSSTLHLLAVKCKKCNNKYVFFWESDQNASETLSPTCWLYMDYWRNTFGVSGYVCILIQSGNLSCYNILGKGLSLMLFLPSDMEKGFDLSGPLISLQDICLTSY